MNGKRWCLWAAPSAHDTVSHSAREYARGSVHANSAEGFDDRVRRTVSGVFHPISPHLADLYFNEIGFRWSQRVVTGQAPRRTRKGRQTTKTLFGSGTLLGPGAGEAVAGLSLSVRLLFLSFQPHRKKAPSLPKGRFKVRTRRGKKGIGAAYIFGQALGVLSEHSDVETRNSPLRTQALVRSCAAAGTTV